MMNIYSFTYGQVMEIKYSATGEALEYLISEAQEEVTPTNEIDWTATTHQRDEAVAVSYLGVIGDEKYYIKNGQTIHVVN